MSISNQADLGWQFYLLDKLTFSSVIRPFRRQQFLLAHLAGQWTVELQEDCFADRRSCGDERMAKIATIEFDDDGRAVVTHTDRLPYPPQSSMCSLSSTAVPPPLPKTRVASSPHKPNTFDNFYDLTKSSPDISPLTSPMTNHCQM